MTRIVPPGDRASGEANAPSSTATRRRVDPTPGLHGVLKPAPSYFRSRRNGQVDVTHLAVPSGPQRRYQQAAENTWENNARKVVNKDYPPERPWAVEDPAGDPAAVEGGSETRDNLRMRRAITPR